MWTPFYCSRWLLPATSAPPSGLLSLWNRKPHKPVLPDIILVMAFYHSNWKVAKTDVVSSSFSVFTRREGPVIGYPSSVCYRKWRCLCGQNSDDQSNYYSTNLHYFKNRQFFNNFLQHVLIIFTPKSSPRLLSDPHSPPDPHSQLYVQFIYPAYPCKWGHLPECVLASTPLKKTASHFHGSHQLFTGPQ